MNTKKQQKYEVVAMNALSDLLQATNAPLVLCPNLERFE